MDRARLTIARLWATRRIVGLSLIAAFVLWFACGAPNCKVAARPLIAALERYHERYGRYPDTLEALVHARLLQAIPHPTWNLGVQHDDEFRYSVEPDLDYYCLGYWECPIFGGLGPAKWENITYVSFRGLWDDSVEVPTFDFKLPFVRAAERFRESRSSADLRLFSKKVAAAHFISWDDIAPAIGPVSPSSIQGRSGLLVEADDNEAAAVFFITRRAHSMGRNEYMIIEILARDTDHALTQWHTVFRNRAEWDWLGEPGIPPPFQ